MGNIDLILTEDGSHTLFNKETGEHYHSVHGALQESLHVFIQAGFIRALSCFDSLKILEVGFGTGLNCLLTLAESTKYNINVGYSAIEPHALDESIYSQLNFCSFKGLENFQGDFYNMHSNKNSLINISPDFRLIKLNSDLESTLLNAGYFNLVYFDAFSPEAQPGIWQPEILIKIRDSMVLGGILVTYCAKGEVRRVLQRAGFSTERLPGPPGKREMLRAIAL